MILHITTNNINIELSMSITYNIIEYNLLYDYLESIDDSLVLYKDDENLEKKRINSNNHIIINKNFNNYSKGFLIYYMLNHFLKKTHQYNMVDIIKVTVIDDNVKYTITDDDLFFQLNDIDYIMYAPIIRSKWVKNNKIASFFGNFLINK